jgi:hypothetical protein
LEVVDAELVPGHFDTFFFIKSFEDFFVGTFTEAFSITSKSA